MHPSCGKFLAGILPKELAIRLAKAKQTAQINAAGIALEVSPVVVRTDKDSTIGNNALRLGLTAQSGHPLAVLCLGRDPCACLSIQLADIPKRWNVFSVGDIIAK